MPLRAAFCLSVVIAPPSLDHVPGVQQVGEPVLVEALIAQAISPAALAMARFVLDWESSQSELDVEVVLGQRDALALDAWNTGARVILMNPPFISWQGIGEEQKRHLTDRLGALASKRPDYASAFFYSARRPPAFSSGAI